MEVPEKPTLRSSRVRRWLGHLFREWTIESWRPIAPAFAKPKPATWSDAQVTLAWLGHATVLINFFGVKILTDPVLFSRIGIRLPGFTIGPKRLTAPALQFHELPKIDLILISHAHFDHLDLRTLGRFDESTTVITARATSDLLRRTRFREINELDWGEHKILKHTNAASPVNVSNIRDTCGSCHGDVRLTRKFGMPSDRLVSRQSRRLRPQPCRPRSSRPGSPIR